MSWSGWRIWGLMKGFEDVFSSGSLGVHFVGIGGVGMAGLARLLHDLGHRVTGSDLCIGVSGRGLMALGISVLEGHDAGHLPVGCDVVVYTSATRVENVERVEARRLGICELQRGQALAMLFNGRSRSVAVGGTHGKTTTTSMLASIFRVSDAGAGWFIGAELQGGGVLARWGDEEAPLVVEADESDGTLSEYRAEVAVITNMDYDHMEFFGCEEDFISCFQAFADEARWVVLPGGEGLHRRLEVEEERVVFFDSDGGVFDALGVRLPLPGAHNVLNAMAASAAAGVLGVCSEDVVLGLERFWLPRRRFECLARRGGRAVFSDYAHHPAELSAVMEQAAGAESAGLRVVFQPHRYSRTRALLGAFPGALVGAREVVLCPVYAASEEPLEGGGSEDLYAACLAEGLEGVVLVDSLDAAWAHVRADWREEEVLLVLGAGDVEEVAFEAQRWLEVGVLGS